MLYVFVCQKIKNNTVYEEIVLSAKPPCDCLSYKKGKKFSLTTKELFNLTHHIYHLLSIPLSISEVIRILSYDYPHFLTRAFLHYLHTNLLEGKKISDILKDSSLLPFFLTRLYIGEETGDFSQAFYDINQYLLQKIKFEEDVQKALRYPCFLLFMLCSVFVVLGFVFMPFLKYIPLFLILFCLIILFLWRTSFFDFLFKNYWIVQALTYLGYLLKAHIPLKKALLITKESFSKLWIQKDLSSILYKIESGSSFQNATEKTFLDTKILQEVFSLAEKKGDYGTFFLKIAQYLFDQWIQKGKRILTMIEPLLILFMGCIILWIVIVAILPLYDDMSLINP